MMAVEPPTKQTPPFALSLSKDSGSEGPSTAAARPASSRQANGQADQLTVVIPTLGRSMLRGTLEALACGSVRPAEVIVVDQGRRDELASMAAEYTGAGMPVTWIPSHRTGRSAGLNDGLSRVRTEYTAITDDDCVPAANWVEGILRELSQRPNAILTGRVEAGGDEPVLSVVTSDEPVEQRKPSLRFDRLSGGNMAIATSVAHRLGPFQEAACMRTAEDAEFAYRALRARVTIRYAPHLVVTHQGWRDPDQRSLQYRDYGLSQGGFYGLHLRRGDLFIALRASIHLLRSLKRWLLGKLRKDDEMAANGRAYVMGLLPGIVAGWRAENS
ncbi:glycosyltransferase family 2 protein [Thioalkalivibrio sp.]|uniref:glycosyltransferase family 2 protein n=1 Tax=Thioalkalivibrio sp. TaxID=2093813 RepID=UPI0035686351